MSDILEQLAELAETHLQSKGDFYRIINMMRVVVKTERLAKRSEEIKKVLSGKIRDTKVQ